MTVTTTANSISYAGNGTTTMFAFPYIFFVPSDLVVTGATDTGAVISASGAEWSGDLRLHRHRNPCR
jgi:hypothetical protein